MHRLITQVQIPLSVAHSVIPQLLFPLHHSAQPPASSIPTFTRQPIADLTEDELRSMEGQLRSHLLERVRFLQTLHNHINSIVDQSAQYISLVDALERSPNPPSAVVPPFTQPPLPSQPEQSEPSLLHALAPSSSNSSN